LGKDQGTHDNHGLALKETPSERKGNAYVQPGNYPDTALTQPRDKNRRARGGRDFGLAGVKSSGGLLRAGGGQAGKRFHRKPVKVFNQFGTGKFDKNYVWNGVIWSIEQHLRQRKSKNRGVVSQGKTKHVPSPREVDNLVKNKRSPPWSPEKPTVRGGWVFHLGYSNLGWNHWREAKSNVIYQIKGRTTG